MAYGSWLSSILHPPESALTQRFADGVNGDEKPLDVCVPARHAHDELVDSHIFLDRAKAAVLLKCGFMRPPKLLMEHRHDVASSEHPDPLGVSPVGHDREDLIIDLRERRGG